MSVVYFDQLLGAERTRKLYETLFSAVFNLFCSFLNLFQWFHAWNKEKMSENEQKNVFFPFFYSSKLVEIHNIHFLKGAPCLYELTVNASKKSKSFNIGIRL